MYTGSADEEPDDRDTELRGHERDRARRVQRRNQISMTIVTWVMAAALALLAYDAGGAALDARRAGRPWLYPAAISVTCALVLAGLIARRLRRRRERISHSGPS